MSPAPPPAGTTRLLHGYAAADVTALPLLCERLLADGDRQDLRWLLANHEPAAIRAWLGTVGGRRLSRRSSRFWSLVLDQPVRVAEPGPLWPL